VLTLVLKEAPPKRVVELTERRYARPTVSRTFEGRDRFAPAAAWLAKGIELTALGRPVGAIQRLDLPQPEVDAERIAGQVLRVDRFGNLITNIDRKTFDRLAGESLEIRVGPHQILRVVSTYADAAPGEVVALFGSTDHLEIAANGSSAATSLDLGRAAPVHVARRA
jgi:S-adenosylmethionine hydrolase